MLESTQWLGIYLLKTEIQEKVQQYAQQRQYNFPGPITQEEFVNHILFLLYKDYYIENQPRYSVGKFGDDPGFKRQFGRGMTAMLKRQQEDNERLGIPGNPYLNCVSQKSKLGNEVSASYHVNASDLAAVMSYPRNTSNREIVKILSSGRAASSKNGAPNAEIYRAYQEYCQMYHKKAQQTDPVEWMDAFMDLANLEVQVFPGFLYAVAKYMGTAGIKKVPEHLMMLCSYVSIGKIHVQSRFLHSRNAWIHLFFSESYNQMINKFEPIFRLHAETYCSLGSNRYVQGLLAQISPSEARAYLSRHYNLFEDYYFPEIADGKAWNPQITRAFRRVTAVLSENGNQYSKNQTSVPRSE